VLALWDGCPEILAEFAEGGGFMKSHFRLFTMFALLPLALVCATAAPAQTLYENGPINGGIDAWTINFGFGIADSFTVSGGNGTVGGLAFGAWLTPGDVLQSAEVSITQFPFSGTTYFDQIVNFTQSACSLNNFGLNVCTETGMFNGPALNNGEYWVDLQNAVTSGGNPVYWDENDGIGCHSPGCPSEGDNGGIGTLPSEAFTILGTATGTGSTPEPSSLLLFGGGLVASFGFARRRLR
jgi:hypothetical protein